MSRWEVQELTHCDGWINNWYDDGEPTSFETQDTARAELDWFLQEMHEAYEQGLLMDVPDRDSFKIVEVK
jgi:hypothetical protein